MNNNVFFWTCRYMQVVEFYRVDPIMCADRELSFVKAAIRSLVISHRDQCMLVTELERDFQDREGSPIPFVQLGFKSVLELLLTIPDVVRLCNDNGRIVVRPISTPAVRHVEQLVQLNNGPSRRGSGRKLNVTFKENIQRYIQGECIQERNVGQPKNYYPAEQSMPLAQYAQPVYNVRAPNYSPAKNYKPNYYSPKNCTPAASYYAPKNYKPNYNPPKQNVPAANYSPTKNYKSCYPPPKNGVPAAINPPPKGSPSAANRSSPPETKPSAPPIVNPQVPVPEPKQNNSNLVMEDAALPSQKTENTTDATGCSGNECPLESCEHVGDSVAATVRNCSVLDWVNMMLNFPSEAMDHTKIIPKVDTAQYFAERNNEQVRILAVLNPNRIWLQSVQQDHEAAKLSSELNSYYRNIASNAWLLEADKAQVGLYCAAQLKGSWRRARIVAPLISGRLKLHFIDVGMVELVNICDVKLLAAIFSSVPAQAIRGSLAYLIPQANSWSRKDSDSLSRLVDCEQHLIAYVVNLDRSCNAVDVVLSNPNGVLINKTFAAEVKVFWTGDNYLSQNVAEYRKRNRTFNEKYPTFCCIEEGHFPTISELRNSLLRNFDFEELYTRLPYVQRNRVVEQISRTTCEQTAALLGVVSVKDLVQRKQQSDSIRGRQVSKDIATL